MRTLGDVYGEHLSHLQYDKKFASRVYKYQLDYLNSNREYLDFYSSNMLGVHRVRFKPSDYDRFMYEILEVDPDALDSDLDEVSSVVKINSVTSDLFNLACVYLMHRYSTSNALGDVDKKRAMYDVASLFFMRSFAALISSYFTYPAEERIVKLAYSNLSGNSLIKKEGTWFKVLDYRARTLVDKNSIHYKTIRGLLEDRVAYVISDSKDRVKDTIKNYYREIVKVRDSGSTIGSINSVVVDLEGVLSVADRINRAENKTIEIKNRISSNSFYNPDYSYVISNMNTNTNNKSLRDVLEWMSSNYMSEQDDTNTLVESVVIYTQHLIKNKVKSASSNDIGRVLTDLKGLYVSNKVRDVELDKIRTIADSIVDRSKKGKLDKGLALATRTALILYISLLYLVG